MSDQYALEVCEPAEGEIRLMVSGEVDLEVGPHLLDSILCAGLACPPGARVVADLERVTFIDSSGLAALVEGHHRIRSQEQQLVLGNVPHRLMRLITLTGLDGVITVEPLPAQEPPAR